MPIMRMGWWQYVSILARPWRTGALLPEVGCREIILSFNPRPSMADGRTDAVPNQVVFVLGFNPRPSMADGRTPRQSWPSPDPIRFNPRPSMADGRTSVMWCSRWLSSMFQSSPVHGGRAHAGRILQLTGAIEFQSSPVHGGRAHAPSGQAFPCGPWFQSSPVHGGRAHVLQALLVKGYGKFQSSPVHGGRAHVREALRSCHSPCFNPRPSMADGRTRKSEAKSQRSDVSILARPWRTGAHLLMTPAASDPSVSILARPWRTGAQGKSLLARDKNWFQSSPVHGGRAHATSLPSAMTSPMFQSSPVHGGRAHGRRTQACQGLRGFQSSPVHGGRAHETVLHQDFQPVRVSILARPWRTGARVNPFAWSFVSEFQSSPVHGGRAHYFKSVGRMSFMQVSILARPWRTGARYVSKRPFFQPLTPCISRTRRNEHPRATLFITLYALTT